MSKTQVVTKDFASFGNLILAFGNTLGQSGELIGVELYDNQGPGGLNKGFPTDFAAVGKAFDAWEPTVAGEGGNFQLQVNVENLTTKQLSGFVSLDEALAFVFPAK
jgi:hypothetical protein